MRSAASIRAGRWAAATTVMRPRNALSAATMRRSASASSWCGCLVEQQGRRPHQRSGQGDALPLATRETPAAVADHGIQALRQRCCEVRRASRSSAR